jgi:dipeptidyl aminopeptidase/acylaminoacyl peptidase
MRPFWRRAALCLILITSTAASRPYTVDDLLKLEDLGAAAIDPTGRWLLIETQRPYETAGRFDYDGYTGYALNRPMVADLSQPGPARALLPEDGKTGYRLGAFSPQGKSVVVYRHRQALWELGVVTLSSGAVRWLGVTPDDPMMGRAVQWRSEEQLIVIGLQDGDLPLYMRRGRQVAQRMPDLWAKTSAGLEAAFTVVGSGRYLEDRARPPEKRLISIDVQTGKTALLARGAFADLQLSPSGRYAALLVETESFQPGGTLPARQIELNGRRLGLTLLDLSSRRAAEPLPGRDVLWNLLSWSPVTDSLLIYTRAPGEDWPAGRLQRLDAPPSTASDGDFSTVELAAARLKPVIDWIPYLMGATVQAGWRGDTPLVLARPVGSSLNARADWYAVAPSGETNLTQDLSEPVVGPPRVVGADLVVSSGKTIWRLRPNTAPQALTGPAGGRIMRLPGFGEGFRATINPPQGSGTQSRAWLIRNHKRGRNAQALTTDWGKIAPLPAQAADTRDLAISPYGLARTHRDAQGVHAISFQARSGAPIPLLKINAPLAAIDVVEPVPIQHAGEDASPLTSWLYLPPGHKTGQRLPLVVMVYPGAVYDSAPYSGRPEAKAFAQSTAVVAGRGYAVLMVSLPRVPQSRDPAQGFVPVIDRAVDAAVAGGQIDPKRMALWGHSFGGYAALVTATRSSRFKAIIALNGISDLTSLMTTFAPHYRVSPEDGLSGSGLFGWGETGQGQLATTPWQEPEHYRANSPLFAADKITTPLLLVGSDLDIIGLGQEEQMFTALWRQAKDVKLLTFWGEGHVVESPANVRAFYDEAFAFLRPFIGDGEATP